MTTALVTGGNAGLGAAFLQLRIIGSTMGTRSELLGVLSLLERTGIRPPIDRVVGFDELPTAMGALAGGEVLGKVVLTP